MYNFFNKILQLFSYRPLNHTYQKRLFVVEAISSGGDQISLSPISVGAWIKNLPCLKASKKSTKKSKWASRNLTEDAAATKIQSAYRAYKARKALRRLKVVVRYRGIIQESHSVKSQAESALNHIHFWSKVQTEIKARWVGMVVDSRTRQKKLDNQSKLDAKLHELEVEWSGGPETMEEILNRIQQREEASAKRERAMAYAFSHQWRAGSNQCFGQSYYDLSKESWGWSWKERWAAVRPWETRFRTNEHSLLKKGQTKHKTTSEVATAKPLKIRILA